MTILPRIIYTLYTVPIPPPRPFLNAYVGHSPLSSGRANALDWLMTSFADKLDSGVGLPDIALYYKAMSLVHILNW